MKNFEPITITLESPVTHGAEEINQLTISRPMVAGDLRGIPVQELAHDHICELAGRLCGVPTPVIKKLSIPDYLRLAEVVSGFLGGSPATGARE